MNNHNFQYKAYQGLLEGKITRLEYDTLVEKVGFLSRVGSTLKGLLSGGKEFKKGYDDKKYKDLLGKAQADLKDTVTQIRKFAEKVGVEDVEDLIQQSVAGILGAANVQPAAVARAITPAAAGASGGGDGGGGATTRGTVAVDNPDAAVDKGASVTKPEQAAASLAVAQGADEKKVDAAAKNPQKVLDDFAKYVSGKSKVDIDVTSKILNLLLKNGMLKSNVSITSESLRASTQSLILEQNGVVLGEISHSDVRRMLNLLNEASKKKPAASATPKTATPTTVATTTAVKAPTAGKGRSSGKMTAPPPKAAKPAPPPKAAKPAPPPKAAKPAPRAEPKSAPPPKAKPAESSSKQVNVPENLKTIVNKLEGQLKEKGVNKTNLVATLKVIDDYFLVKEGRVTQEVLVERWQRLAGIL